MESTELPNPVLAELEQFIGRLADARQDVGTLNSLLESERRNSPGTIEEKRAANRRLGAMVNLRWLIAFLDSPAMTQWQPVVLERGVTNHLRDLLHSLEDVQAGARADLFEPISTGKRVASPSQEEFRGKTAAVLELVLDAGAELDEAARMIAHDLDAAGYRRPRDQRAGRGNDRINAGTVKAWRRKAKEAPASSRIRSAYEQWLELGRLYAAQGAGPGQTAAKMMAGLAQDLPGGRAFYTPLERRAGGKK
jgi:hypothetical protein